MYSTNYIFIFKFFDAKKGILITYAMMFAAFGQQAHWPALFFRILGKNEEEFIFLEFVFYKYTLSFQRK